MHAAEPAGGEHRDARGGGQVRGRGNRRRAVTAAGREHRKVADADLDHSVAFGNAPQRWVVQTDARFAADDGNRGRHRPTAAHRLFDLARDTQVVRTGQTVADDRAFQGDDGPSGGQRVRNFGMDTHVVLRLLRNLDDFVGRVDHRYPVRAALVGFSGYPQHRARLDVTALSRWKRHADLAAVVPEHDPAGRFLAVRLVLQLADPAFHGGPAPGDNTADRNHRCRALRVLVGVHGSVL